MAKKSAYLLKLEAQQQAYQEFFDTPAGQEIFQDLFEKFFRESPIGATTDETLVNIGKAEVIRYIMVKRNVTLKDVEVLHGGRQPEWEPDR